MKHFKRLFALFIIMGMVYFTLEGLWRGWTNIIMLPVGGMCALLIGLLNERPRFIKLKIWQQCLIGTAIILSVEFISGCIVNLWLGLNIWDYSTIPFNVLGQVCLPYGLLWFTLCPFAIWLDDWLRWRLYKENTHYPVYENYIDLITSK
ncbi:MAG TPA: hypothetical protein VF941_12560 [Clostridia bacterium]